MNRDEKEFEAWLQKSIGRTYPEKHNDRIIRGFYREMWEEATKTERARAKGLIEALEWYERKCHLADTHESFWTKGINIITNVKARMALAKYKGGEG